MSQESIEVVKSLFEAWRNRDPQAALNCIDPDVEIDMTGAPFPGTQAVARGHAGLQRTIAPWLEAWEGLEFIPEAFIQADDQVIVWVRIVGKGRGSGVPTELRVASVYAVRNGLVKAWRAYPTLAAAASAVGI